MQTVKTIAFAVVSCSFLALAWRWANNAEAESMRVTNASNNHDISSPQIEESGVVLPVMPVRPTSPCFATTRTPESGAVLPVIPVRLIHKKSGLVLYSTVPRGLSRTFDIETFVLPVATASQYEFESRLEKLSSQGIKVTKLKKKDNADYLYMGEKSVDWIVEYYDWPWPSEVGNAESAAPSEARLNSQTD